MCVEIIRNLVGNGKRIKKLIETLLIVFGYLRIILVFFIRKRVGSVPRILRTKGGL